MSGSFSHEANALCWQHWVDAHTEYRRLEAGHHPVLLLGGGQGQLGQDGEEEKEEEEHNS